MVLCAVDGAGADAIDNIFFIRIPRFLTGWPEMRPNRRITMIDINVMSRQASATPQNAPNQTLQLNPLQTGFVMHDIRWQIIILKP